ncbi:DnaJ domain-containing protein [Podospora didyma]|uniref:DnaJ domain-containing protein n=1 Tax=Podospora didyma TaxID=330526 RepID=A0AAE0KJQ4_9PEZI|nr:DnaJ domain-containing protein [Podospora didyma]
MPLRYTLIGGAAAPVGSHHQHHHLFLGGRCLFRHANHHPQQHFHASRILQDDRSSHSDNDQNHYDTLNVHRDASHAEIKKSFYHLSKQSHPDHNPADPGAPRRFMRISEAYSVLSHAEKRARYDRTLPRRPHVPFHPNAAGSYHSTGPAGGRPASGLSRRRGTFTGPPPSFFRSGGWGAQGAKRRAAHEESTGGASTGAAPGMGPGQDPHRHKQNTSPHFDRESHERTHRHNDERAARAAEHRMRGEKGGGPYVPDWSPMASFWLVTGILGMAMVGPYMLFGGWKQAEAVKRDKKGTKT